MDPQSAPYKHKSTERLYGFLHHIDYGCKDPVTNERPCCFICFTHCPPFSPVLGFDSQEFDAAPSTGGSCALVGQSAFLVALNNNNNNKQFWGQLVGAQLNMWSFLRERDLWVNGDCTRLGAQCGPLWYDCCIHCQYFPSRCKQQWLGYDQHGSTAL